MSNISDIIEEFINKVLGSDNSLSISRNELAQFFDCAPSQINYVLSTRFTVDRGFVIESRRGGGGHIRLVRLAPDRNSIILNLEKYARQGGLTFTAGCQIVESLKENSIISEREAQMIRAAITDKALTLPIEGKEFLRANILRSILIELSRLPDKKEAEESTAETNKTDY